MKTIIAVEGGGTHTRVGRYDGAGGLVRECHGGPSNPAAYGLAASARCIVALVRAVMGDDDPGEAFLFAGLAGAADSTLRHAMAASIGGALRCAHAWVASDIHALLYANTGNHAGVLAIAGTGAAVLARNDDGKMVKCGGRGALFGDDGSACAVAVSALRSCARSLDGVDLETSLPETLAAAAGLRCFEDFVDWSARATKRDIAALAPVVAEAAEDGDIAARACIEEEARRLAALAAAAQERLHLEPGTPLYEYGGLLENCALFRDAFRDALNQYSDLRPLPCANSGHRAVHCLSTLVRPPDWVSCWEQSDGEPAGVLPDTEKADASAPIDVLSPLEIVHRMHTADARAVTAVGEAAENIAEAVALAARSIRLGGRLIYAGAGTSGRLGVLDASECPPTYGVPPERVCALIAGGDRALRFSIEGAEDNHAQGVDDARNLNLCAEDFVVAIAASGATPYVAGVLQAAHDAGAKTALVSSNPASALKADVPILLDTGAEVLPGSTRLKAGTAAKLTLNMISTGAFAKAGFVYRGRMIGMKPTNTKLRLRAARIVAELADRPREEAAQLLEASGYRIAAAILMARNNISLSDALTLLEQNAGRLDEALDR